MSTASVRISTGVGTDGSAGDGFVSSGGFGNRTRLTVLGKEGADKVKISLSLIEAVSHLETLGPEKPPSFFY